MTQNLDSLYQEIILDHYKAPHHAGLREPFEAEVQHVNPTCGDEITLRVHLSGTDADTVVEDVSYAAEGCSISQAATSVMTDLVIGKTVPEALAIHREFLSLMQGLGNVEPDEEILEDGIAFAGVAKFPARVKCALMAWMAWKDATSQILGAAPAVGESVPVVEQPPRVVEQPPRVVEQPPRVVEQPPRVVELVETNDPNAHLKEQS